MAVERTLSIVKPDGVAKNLIGEVYRRFEKAGLSIVAAKMMKLRQDQAKDSMPFTRPARSTRISCAT